MLNQSVSTVTEEKQESAQTGPVSKNAFHSLKESFSETRHEMKRVAWPSFQNVFSSLGIILMIVAVLSVLVTVLDKTLGAVIYFLIERL